MKNGSLQWYRSLRYGVVLMSVVSFALGCGGAQSGAQSSGGASGEGGLVGAKAPEIQAESVTGDGPSSIADAAGQVVIVDFWATYCDPCRKSFPKYQELVDKHAGKVVVIAVSVDDPEDVQKADIQAFADELNATFPIVWDKERKTASSYKPAKMPTSYLIDTKGIVRHIHAGYKEGEAEEIASEVDTLLAEGN